jgi:hypothetical protein
MKKPQKATSEKPVAEKPVAEKPVAGRREFLRGLGFSTVAAASVGPFAEEAQADTETNDEKRKARYQANSAEVQTFYRVNRYPN